MKTKNHKYSIYNRVKGYNSKWHLNDVECGRYNITLNNTKLNLKFNIRRKKKNKKQIMSEKITLVLYYECTKSAILA